MRSFILALFTILVVGLGAHLVLENLRPPADVAFTTPGARIDPGS